MQQAQDVAAADQSAPRVPEAAAAAAAAMPVAGCPPRRMFCLHISQDGRTVELRPYIFLGPPGPQANGHAASSSSSAPAPVSAVTAPPVAASSGTAHEPELRRLTTAEIDAHEESYFQADDAAIDRADCWDRLLTSTGSGPSRRAAPLRRKEFEHGFTPPPSFPARSRWPLMIGKLLRRHGYWVDFEGRLGSKTSKGSKSTAVISVRQAKRWEERHQAYGERDARWEARKEELFALRQARRARREAAKKAAREECDSRVRKVKREAFWHWEGWHHEEFRDWDDDWHPIGGPIDLSHPPGITRNEAMAARLGLDAGTFNALQELQQRDIRPEDYDLLGRLDETVKKATLDGCKLRIFPTEVFEAASSAQADAQGPSCGVCLVDFQEGEELRVLLPCRHRFHKDCIDYWLLERATTCPMCVTDLKEIIEEADKDKDQEGCASQSDPASSQGHAAEADHELLAMMQCEPLLAMGFSLEQAMAAVLRTGGNVEAAVNLLLEQDAA